MVHSLITEQFNFEKKSMNTKYITLFSQKKYIQGC